MKAEVKVAETAGGHMITIFAQVADGLVIIEDTYQTIVAEGLDSVGSVLTHRRATLNGLLVKYPEKTQQLYEEAMALVSE